MLRLDQIHPLISGNKWFKLRGYLELATSLRKSTIVTFGGAYSNHLHAVAAACKLLGVRCAGVVRGERPSMLSPTLVDAAAMGMDLFFVSRKDYTEKKLPEMLLQQHPEHLLIPEGGYGPEGIAGAATMLAGVNLPMYSHIITACGTGTTLAGLVLGTTEKQRVTGISVLRNHLSLSDEVDRLLPDRRRGCFEIINGYHQGGYARHTPDLLRFMNEWYRDTGIATDFVYTGKMMFAVSDLAAHSFFAPGSHVLLIHTGGLQGNRSLPNGSLIFQ